MVKEVATLEVEQVLINQLLNSMMTECHVTIVEESLMKLQLKGTFLIVRKNKKNQQCVLDQQEEDEHCKLTIMNY